MSLWAASQRGARRPISAFPVSACIVDKARPGRERGLRVGQHPRAPYGSCRDGPGSFSRGALIATHRSEPRPAHFCIHQISLGGEGIGSPRAGGLHKSRLLCGNLSRTCLAVRRYSYSADRGSPNLTLRLLIEAKTMRKLVQTWELRHRGFLEHGS